MGIIRVLGLAAVIISVLIPIAIKVICHLDQFKWVVPPGSVFGKTAIVTGANSGLGLETARALAKDGAEVVMACRTLAKCKTAMDYIRTADSKANLKAQSLDLSDPDSVRSFATEFLASHDRLDLLINNAAVMATEYSSVRWPGGTVEVQFATNHLGPFLLTGLLGRMLEATPGARVVNHSSSMSDFCRRVGDVHEIAHVSQIFTWSLNQRFSGVLSVACHPGYTGTNLQHRAAGIKSSFISDKLFKRFMNVANAAFSQPVSLGAQPQLYAATHSSLKGGEVVGPRFLMFGTPVVESWEFCQLGADDRCEQEDLDTLWVESERLSGFSYSKK